MCEARDQFGEADRLVLGREGAGVLDTTTAVFDDTCGNLIQIAQTT